MHTLQPEHICLIVATDGVWEVRATAVGEEVTQRSEQISHCGQSRSFMQHCLYLPLCACLT